MSGELAASLVLKFSDQGSGAAARALQVVKRSLSEVEAAARSASSNAVSAFRKLASAREILGIRSEKVIQNEIRQTEAAYRRLADSGQASARELARAQDAMRQKVGDLRRELDGVKTSAGGVGNALTKALAVVGAWQAGKALLSGPIGQTMSYDRALANISNTAYAGQSLDARRAGMRTLDAAIVSAVRAGGGTREGALSTLDKLVASGAFADVNEAARLLPALTKAGTASGADPAMLADIAIRAKQTFGLADTGLALDQAMKAGQLGGFDLRDMAKWLPQQMAAAGLTGLKGNSGFMTLLAANQAAAITAGTRDEAGNNLVNLLAKINSRDAANDAKRLGINLTGTLQAAREKGVNSLDAFVNLAEQVAAKDKNYQALKGKAAGAKGEEQRATYEAMGNILQGSAIGQLVQDRQALMALVGIMNNRGYMNNIRAQLGGARGTAVDAFGLVSETASFKTEMMAQNKAIAMQDAMDKVNPLWGGMADGLSGIMERFPGFSAAVVGATTALVALAAAAGAASLANVLTGGGGAGAAAAGKAGMLSRIGGKLASGLGAAGRWAGAAVMNPWTLGVAGAGAAGYGVGSLLNAGINWGVGKATDGRESLGTLIYELLHREKEPAKVDVSVRVENGNLVAEVNQAATRRASRG